MPRTGILGLVCTTFLVLLGFPAVPEEPTGKGADTESGQQTFNNACRTCHTTKEGDNRLGPNLHNIIGRKAGSLQNYGYSSAMKGADFVWDKEKLDRFIAKPDEVVPGNNMKPYGGLTSAEDRASGSWSRPLPIERLHHVRHVANRGGRSWSGWLWQCCEL